MSNIKHVSGYHMPARATIIPYYVLAAICFVVVTFLYLFAIPSFQGHYFQPHILAIVHLSVLGWATMIIMGATNQLSPVIADNPLFSEKLPIISLILLSTGVTILIPSFWFFKFTDITYIGVSFILVAFILHAYNIAITFREKKSSSIFSDFILTAHIWLIATVIIGFTLLLNLRFAFFPQDHLQYLKIHASVGMLGWFLQLVIGVSSRLIPMFLLSKTEKSRYLTISFYLLNSALVMLFIEGFTFGAIRGYIIYILLILLSVLLYLVYVWHCYKSAMRKNLDYGMKQTFMALFFLLLPVIFISVAAFYHQDSVTVIKAYGFSFFAGFITVIIMGQTFKTLPFIVWMHISDPDKLPEVLPKDLYKEELLRYQMYIYLPGFLSFILGMLAKSAIFLYAGASFMCIAALLYGGHVLFIINKLKRK